MTMILPGTDQAITSAAELLKAGKLVAFPTETVYGLGADATNEAAVRKIFEVKGRPTTNPLIVHVRSIEEMEHYADLARAKDPETIRHRLRALSPLWPGPLSVIVPKSNRICNAVSAGGDTMAFRIPRHPVALKLLEACQLPIAGPSANPSMYISPTTAEHVEKSLGSAVECILDGGPCVVGLESTVVSLIDDVVRILRPGAISADELRKHLGCNVEDFKPGVMTSDTKPLLSPGLLAKHYSPTTPVVLRDRLASIGNLPSRIGVILFNDHSAPCEALITRVLSDAGNLEEIATNLFAALRELDEANLNLIVVDTCEPVGLGAAIMDRLIRASAP